MNRITLDCSDERAKEIMEAVMFDSNPDDEENTGFGTLDFNKLLPLGITLGYAWFSMPEKVMHRHITGRVIHTLCLLFSTSSNFSINFKGKKNPRI